MKFTPYDFNRLEQNQQIEVINNVGFLVNTKHLKHQKKVLYKVFSFYVEVSYKPSNEVLKITTKPTRIVQKLIASKSL